MIVRPNFRALFKGFSPLKCQPKGVSAKFNSGRLCPRSYPLDSFPWQNHFDTLRSFCICITMTVSYLLRKGWCCEPRFRRCTIRVKYQPLQVQVEKLGKGIEGRDDMKKFYPRPCTTQADIRMATATVKRQIV